MTDRTILVIDDEYLIRWSLQKNLEKAGYRVVAAETGEEGLERAQKEVPDLVLIDFKLPGIDGLEVLQRIRRIDQCVIPIMVTASQDVELVVKAMRSGAYDYVVKPLDFTKLLLSVEKALETYRLKSEARHLREMQKEHTGLSHIVVASETMRKVFGMIEKVALSDSATVLICGESGTGKEIVANALHRRSRRAHMPFVTVSCAGFAEHLLENELCGHEKGAFTDAKEVKKGLLEVAHGGSLFLDEIGDTNPGMQAKLLRLVEQKTFRRMGGTKDINVDVRIITATNKDLKQLVAEGKFREDLFYRINIVALRLPPLRDRRDDILPLAKFFVRRYNEVLGKAVGKISREVEVFLLNYCWPGNVRELKNVIERAMILGEGDTLLIEHLPLDVMEQARRPAGPASVFRIPPEGISMERVEEAFVRQALDMTGGNQSKAARLLDISRDSFRYRMQKYGINDSAPRRSRLSKAFLPDQGEL